MKQIKKIMAFMILGTAMLFASCEDENVIQNSILEIDKTEIKAPVEGAKINIKVTSNVAWTISSKQGWAVPEITNGEGSREVEINITENLYRDERKDILTIATVDGTQTKTIEIVQETAQKPDENYAYKLPVVFHVIYRDANNEKQNLSEGYLKEVLSDVNKIWKEAAPHLNVEFVMATETPNGVTMTEPGVHRVQWNIDKIDYKRFMGYTEAAPKRYRDLLWDQNRYVNICLYNFSDPDITGVTTLPYTIAPDTLDGLEKLPNNIAPTELPISYCVSVNSLYAYTKPGNNLESTNFVSTIAHELGHYLGLRHVFGEDANMKTDYNEDSDFCKDTPTYNRKKYLKELSKYTLAHPKFTQEDVNKWILRTNSITGEQFRSNNIMDYYWTLRNKFTEEQTKRMQYVLLHSPFVPGPKIRTAKQKIVSKRNFKMPVRRAICQ